MIKHFGLLVQDMQHTITVDMDRVSKIFVSFESFIDYTKSGKQKCN